MFFYSCLFLSVFLCLSVFVKSVRPSSFYLYYHFISCSHLFSQTLNSLICVCFHLPLPLCVSPSVYFLSFPFCFVSCLSFSHSFSLFLRCSLIVLLPLFFLFLFAVLSRLSQCIVVRCCYCLSSSVSSTNTVSTFTFICPCLSLSQSSTCLSISSTFATVPFF